MPIKLVFFYTQAQSGFSETYYMPGSDPRAAVLSLDQALITNMSYWRHPACQLYAVRASTTDPPKKSYLQIFGGYYKGGGIVGQVGTEPDVQSTDAVVRINGIGGHSRRVYFRGLRDIDTRVSSVNTPIPSAYLAGGIANAFGDFKRMGFQIRFTQLPPDGGQVWHSVTSVMPATISSSITRMVIGATAIGSYAKGDKIVIQRADSRVLPRFPRIATIYGIDTVNAALEIPYAIPGGGTLLTPRLRVTKLVYAYENMDQQLLERFSEHKTGRFFGQLRGRSRAIRSGPQ